MSLLKKSFISSEQLSDVDIAQIFDRAKSFKTEFTKKRRIDHLVKSEGIAQKVIAMVFSEPSTRTRLSFQMASFRLGLRPVILDNLAASSISKGETFEDTLRNIAAMQPDALVVRYGVDHAADKMLNKESIVHCNWHTKEVTTINNYLPNKKPLKILITSGASCPDALVEEVIAKLASFYNVNTVLDAFEAQMLQ